MGMQEAFKQAASTNPHSGLSDQVRTTDRRITADRRGERESKQLERLKEKWLKIGKQWFGLEIEGNLWGALYTNRKELRREFLSSWQALGGKSEKEIAACLIRLAEGMGISEENLHPTYRESIGSWISKNPLQQIRYELGSTHLSNPARLFVGQFATLAGYSEEELKQLNEYLHRGAGLSGKVQLTHTAAAMAHWIISKR